MEFEDKVNKLLGQPEGIELEYKQVLPPPSAIAREIAAFANSAGGTVIFGVRDDLSVEGLAGGVPAPAIVEAALERLNYRPNVQHGFINVGLGQNQRQITIVSPNDRNNLVIEHPPQRFKSRHIPPKGLWEHPAGAGLHFKCRF